MSGSKVILDTNIIIDYLDEQPDTVTVVDDLSQIFIPAIVVGELYIGVYRSLPRLKQDKQKKIEKFLGTATILPVNKDAAVLYAQIQASLFSKGRPIPENDIWIAAIALQHNLSVYENDKHFREIDGIQLSTLFHLSD